MGLDELDHKTVVPVEVGANFVLPNAFLRTKVISNSCSANMLKSRYFYR